MIDRSRSPVPRQQQIQNIQIVLQTLAGGHTPTLTLDARAMLSALRMKIAAAIHQEGGVKQTLVFRESVLPEAEDHASLADLGICDGATLSTRVWVVVVCHTELDSAGSERKSEQGKYKSCCGRRCRGCCDCCGGLL